MIDAFGKKKTREKGEYKEKCTSDRAFSLAEKGERDGEQRKERL